jgi:F-type H+-transporting ATPase subunit delta
MKSQHRAAKSYAKALFALARERGQAEAIGGELGSLAGLLAREHELRAFLARPWVAPAAKRRVASEIAMRLEVSGLTRDFLALVAARGRVEELDAIVTAYGDLVDAEAGRVRAQVRTAVPLTADERTTLASRLRRALAERMKGRGAPAEVVLEEVVDRDLIGGFVAEIGSFVVDGTLDGQLARIRQRLGQG